jgi:group I intron endonuclease
MIYSNADTNRSQILLDNKGRAGIYQWTHLLTGRIYIGSSSNLALRLKDYYSKTYIEKNKSMHICNAIIHYGHSQFSLTIFEFINISNLSKGDARKLIIEREQFYLNLLNPEFNILNTAGSSLGFNHSPVTLALMSEAKTGKNNPMYGKKGENNPMFGRTHSKDSLAKMSLAKIGKKNYIFGDTHSEETLTKMSKALGTQIFVYSSDRSSLLYTFNSARKAAEHFKVCCNTILKYSKSGKLFKNEWILSTSKD